MTTFIRIITLNCWGLPQPFPIGSKRRKIRFEKISYQLSSGDYDIVALQEIWSESDFQRIQTDVESILPYSHYFHSGVIGSGVCIFSKFPIVSTLMHRYSLNGYVHHVHRGDWFGGKVVGMAQLIINSFLVNVYCTHLHAEYDRHNDLYLPHRLSQALELSQFVKHTTSSAHFYIVVGDLNLEPTDLGYKLIVSNGQLTDAWSACNGQDFRSGCTCDRPDNVYTDKASLKDRPDGKRLDYVMFGTRTDVQLDLLKCENRLNSIVDSEVVENYSDHVAVYAEFAAHFTANSAVESTTSQDSSLLDNVVEILEGGERKANWNRRFYCLLITLLSLVYLASLAVDFDFLRLVILMKFLHFVLILSLGFCIWYGVIGLKMEEKALKAAKLSAKLLRTDRNREH